MSNMNREEAIRQLKAQIDYGIFHAKAESLNIAISDMEKLDKIKSIIDNCDNLKHQCKICEYNSYRNCKDAIFDEIISIVG